MTFAQTTHTGRKKGITQMSLYLVSAEASKLISFGHSERNGAVVRSTAKEEKHARKDNR